MQNTKETLVTAFALFSLFFGAGNLIFPPLLGFQSGNMWWLVALGFCLSAVLIPLFGILAHAKIQGTIFDFGKKVSRTFSLMYSILIYAISVSLPSPRTASVTHEIAVQPFFDSPYIVTSIIYFSLVFIFVMNRSKLLNILGKVLTPAIILILLAIIGITVFYFDFNFGTTHFDNPFTYGILEGYQTFDAIGAVVVGGVIIVSVNISNKEKTFEEKRVLIRKAGWLAGIALFVIYAGLIFTGAVMHNQFDADITRTALLNSISIKTLGSTANLFLSILVSLACFTTAVGIVTGTSDFIRHLFNDSQIAYIITAVLGCVLGVVMGQFNVAYIVNVALPALMFIYPITIVLILLNILPEKYASTLVFRSVVIVTAIFSIPDFLSTIGYDNEVIFLEELIPLSKYNMGWVIPGFLSFAIVNVLGSKKPIHE
ncbi:branched-chain amino acid transport system II carrier protein [Cellulophaga algicola DSM 14237]|uniref:Branched-chain amino acid transport system II carrier protein n=1 Tax=Cellulophaga algicola (strain DSM 14237 / IC166 / ACAM 630) TaxID=688270 RepID=E6XB62_CELAD|nr:branched-chain amino acid transport system II carrier protein [Cellulophaga algicola]ADV48918.1 branched-chain amino acid transport system II carrier protein [Cellulophaga algicola DSM 14237]